MKVSEMLKSVQSEVASFLEIKKNEQKNLSKRKVGNSVDKFVKSNQNDLMNTTTRTRYVNGVCYSNMQY